MPSSQFEEEELDIDEELAQPSLSPKSVNSLSLGDAQELVAALTAISLKFGNNDKGVIATMNELLKRSDVLNHEQRDVIAPLLGELKALLLTSQDELKNFNQNAQKSLESQIKETIAKVDFSPIEKKVAAANNQILESTNALKTKVEEIETIAARTKRLGFFASTKYLLVGLLGGAGFLYGFFTYREHGIEQKLKAEYDAKIAAMDTRTVVWKNLKDDQWGASIVEINGLKHIQLVVRDNSQQINLGRSYTTPDDKGKKYPVTFVNILIFK